MDKTRFERGWTLLQSLHQPGGKNTLAAFETVAPDLSRYVIEFAYGDIYQRPGLDLAQRQLLTIACLVTQGSCGTELKAHCEAALKVGMTPQMLVESILHCIPYVGFPRVLEAMMVVKAVFEETITDPDES